MKVVPLQSNPWQVGVVARMIYAEFVEKTRSKATKEAIIEYLSHPNERQLPYTLVALKGEQCVGTVSIFEQDIKGRAEYSPCIAALVVDVNERGCGVGVRLVAEAVAVAKRLGYQEIFLKTETAREFYERLGWVCIEIITDEFGELSYVFKVDIGE